ncbi:hypothetical protein [Micromonospora sp. NPDC051006]|uniref:hypothetical protein n=1 Tax=Micromonospora sp. NPDC051006 TaxID=3364283 RepID=UPI0037B4FAF9
MDYYVILGSAPGRRAAAETIVVEEFTHATDWTTSGLHSAGWAPDAGWRSAASVSRGMRADPRLRARVVPVTRDGADEVHGQLGGGPLPAEPALRGHFRDQQSLPASTPLRLGPAEVPEGFHERRVYRVLFAGDLPVDRLTNLAAHWRPTAGHRPSDPAPGGRRRVGRDEHSWTLRRVGRDIAWALDLTSLLATTTDHTVGPILHELTSVVRLRGLVPVTTERFA